MNQKINKLTELGAGNFDHIDGTLMQHLVGTRDVLASWGASTQLQDAGLFHAAYSTAGFGNHLVALDQRQQIADIIGKGAEKIVYEYCACDREVLYPRLATSDNPQFSNRFTGEEYFLAPDLFKNFCELTVSNEIEIAIGNPRFLKKHGAARHVIYKNMSTFLSEPANAAIDSIFGAIAE